MTAAVTASGPPDRSLGPRMLNKVPEITLWFWVIKILCTTVGETASDYLQSNLGWGLTNTTYVTGAVLAGVLIAQFRLRRYVPAVYWAAVVLISVVGTQITDNLVDDQGVALRTTVIVFSIALAAAFAAWYASERTLSIHTIVTTRREAFYWLTILFTFALGTAAGDLATEALGLGFNVGVLAFTTLIAAIGAAYGLGVNAVLTFWIAYILTRPFGAALGDLLTQAKAYGGLGMGATWTSVLFLSVIVALVGVEQYTVSDRDLERTFDRSNAVR